MVNAHGMTTRQPSYTCSCHTTKQTKVRKITKLQGGHKNHARVIFHPSAGSARPTGAIALNFGMGGDIDDVIINHPCDILC